MTYEELCNAVLPVWLLLLDRVLDIFCILVGCLLCKQGNKLACFFSSLFVPLQHWHNLRKHNGERYAYSSHSQAVLDCLRNRNEWARLIDRGPKVHHMIIIKKICLLYA